MTIIVKEQPAQNHESKMCSQKGKHIISVAREKLRNRTGETRPLGTLKVRLRGLACVFGSPH